MRFVFLIILATSLKSLAMNPASLFNSVCSQKMGDPICAPFQDTKKFAENIAYNYYNQVPYNKEIAIVSSFILDPKISTHIGAHRFEIKPDKFRYSFDF